MKRSQVKRRMKKISKIIYCRSLAESFLKHCRVMNQLIVLQQTLISNNTISPFTNIWTSKLTQSANEKERTESKD